MNILMNTLIETPLIRQASKVVCVLWAERTVHYYRSLVPWKNNLELSDYLTKNVIYNDNGLVVVNKPYGVSFSRDSGSKDFENSQPCPEDLVFKNKSELKTKNSLHKIYFSSGIGSDNLNLINTLQHLQNRLNYNKLYLSRVPEKYLSGVAILTTSKDLVEKVNLTRRHLPTGKDKYLAIVVGVPRYKSGVVKLGLKLESHAKFGKRVTVVQKWSNNAYKRGEIRIGTFHYQHICSGYNNLTSLLEVKVDLRKHHACRVFASDYLLSPVLGDNLFGSRVQTVMGVSTLVHHFTDVANSPQRLSEELYKLLGLNAAEAGIIPVHIHLAEVLLPQLLKGRKPLLLKAPVPHYFTQTCERLGLIIEDQAMNSII